MRNFYIWITALSKIYESKICVSLLNLGYTVAAAGQSGKVNTDTYDSAALFALKVSKTDANQYIIYDDVASILSDINAYYYSLIIVESSETLPLWTSTNIRFESPVPNIGSPNKKKELN